MWLRQASNITSHSSQRERYRGDRRQAASTFKDVPCWLVTAFLPTCHLLTFNQMAYSVIRETRKSWSPIASHVSCKTLAWESLLLMKGENGYWEQLPLFASRPPIIHLFTPIYTEHTPSPRGQPKEPSSYYHITSKFKISGWHQVFSIRAGGAWIWRLLN